MSREFAKAFVSSVDSTPNPAAVATLEKMTSKEPSSVSIENMYKGSQKIPVHQLCPLTNHVNPPHPRLNVCALPRRCSQYSYFARRPQNSDRGGQGNRSKGLSQRFSVLRGRREFVACRSTIGVGQTLAKGIEKGEEATAATQETVGMSPHRVVRHTFL